MTRVFFFKKKKPVDSASDAKVQLLSIWAWSPHLTALGDVDFELAFVSLLVASAILPAKVLSS